MKTVALAEVDQLAGIRWMHARRPRRRAQVEGRIAAESVRGRPLGLAQSPAGALLAHLGSGETEPDDPGYLEFQDPNEGRIVELEAHLEEGRLPEFVFVWAP